MNSNPDPELRVRFQQLRQADRLAVPAWRELAATEATSRTRGASPLSSWRLWLPVGTSALVGFAFIWQTFSTREGTPSLSATLPELMKPSEGALFARMDEASPAFPSDFLLPESQRFRLP